MIQNLIFDVGEVLVGYRWEEMLTMHGLSPERAAQVYDSCFDTLDWLDYDKGLVTLEEVIRRAKAGHPDAAEDLEWFLNNPEMMVVPRPRIWQRLCELHDKGMGIYILSNYSREYFNRAIRGFHFFRAVDGCLVSYEVGLAKPDPAIYTCLLERFRLKAETCLFLDDRFENVEAARQLGIAGYHVTGEEALADYLSGLFRNLPG